MFDPQVIRSLLAICVVTAPLAAPSSALTPQTPPPCSADGHCKPDFRQWGYTQQKWRRWPGSEAEDKTAADAEGRVQLPGTSPPRKEVEDQTAPPKVEGIEPQPRDLEDDTLGPDEEFAPRQPGEDVPPRAPERQPNGEMATPDNNRPGFPRDGNRVPDVELPFGQPLIPQPDLNQPGRGQPGLGQPGLGQPELGQPRLGQPPLGQPPVRPREPTLDQPTLPPPGGTNPDDPLFPSFNSRSIDDDAPPALPLLNGPVVERARESVPTAGVVRQAPTTIPKPTADRTNAVRPSPARAAFVPRRTAPSENSGLAGSRAKPVPKVDRSIEAASYVEDAPPSLPSGFLQ